MSGHTGTSPALAAVHQKTVLPIRPGISLLEPGDLFTLPFDSELLELDLLQFRLKDPAWFARLFPEGKVLITIPGRRGGPLTLKVEHTSTSLSGAGIGKHLASLTGLSRVTLVLVSCDPLTYQLTLPPRTAPKAEDLSLAESTDMLLLQPGWQDVLFALESGRFAREDLFQLHEEACTLDLCQPLDKLISLTVLPDFVPYPHQVQAVKTVIGKFRGRALLCDEVGLGKTIEACLVLLEYMLRGLAKKVLILTPPSLVGQWQEELRHKFGLDFVTNDEQRFKGWEAHQHVIASLATAKLESHCQTLSKIEFDLVIVDEAHHLRNRNTKAWQLVNNLRKRYILLLTATPVQNSLNDLYSLVTVLKPGYLKTLQEFRRQFVAGGDCEPKNTDRLRGLLKAVMIRNKRSHTNLILTPRHARTLELDLHPDESDFYARVTALVRRGMFKVSDARTLVDHLTLQHLQLEAGSSVSACLCGLTRLAARDLPDAYKEEIVSVLAAGNRLANSYFQTCRKAHACEEIVRTFNDKVIIFTRFRETHDFLAAFLKQRGISIASFHGGMKRIEKDEAIETFRSEAQVLISSESGGEGRNLQFCRALINYDLPWNPMRIEQRIGRIHRLGQDRDVHIFNLAARGTAEAMVLELLDKKINLFELVVGELDMILGDLDSDKEFEDIIFEIWSESQDDSEVSSRLESLGRKLLDAKAHYLRSQAFDDRLFGDALVST